MYAEVAWVLVSSGTQVEPQVILDPDYLPDYLSLSYDYGNTNLKFSKLLEYSKIYLQAKIGKSGCFPQGFSSSTSWILAKNNDKED